jgi:hypothetical protein
MRSFAAAAIIGLAAAVPHYGYGAESSSTPEAYYPVPSTTAEEYPTYPSSTPADYYPVSSSAADYYPASSSTPCPESSTAGEYYPVSSSAADYYPVSSAAEGYPSGYVTKTVYSTSVYTVTSCGEYVTKCPAHSTIEYTTEIPVYTTVCPESETPIYTPYPTYPVETSTPCSSTSTVTITIPYSSGAPYYPTGTGAPHYPPVVGTASSSGYLKPSAPPVFTGAASHAKVGGFVAGVGAFAAFFL